MTAKRNYELLVSGARKPVLWAGLDGEAASADYEASHAGAVVEAWKLASSPVTILGRGVIIG